ncbi:MAG: hypothetical protein ACI4WW_00515 [Candidatus Coprovivens sp.]
MDFDRIKKIIENDTDTEMVVIGMNKPNKFKSIIGFLFSLFVFGFIVFFMGFQFNIFFILVFLIDLLCLFYFGVNLFTKKGIATPKYKEVRIAEKEVYEAMVNSNVDKDEENEEFSNDENYDIDSNNDD